jgi:S1-C subfamily serine protease
MIRREIVQKVLVSTCGVVRLDQKHEESFAGNVVGGKVAKPSSTLTGTGFLVRKNIVLTNRHVIEEIAQWHKTYGDHDLWYLEFAYPRPNGGWSTTLKRITNVFAFIDPSGRGAIDAGFVEFNGSDEDSGFNCCVAVQFGDLSEIIIGADVGVCGYPLGDELLINGPGFWRSGPVVHAGIISGVAPFETTNPREITAVLTDLNSAPGMSGAPMFTPKDGKVVGLHYAGYQGTVGFALPVDQTRVDGWLEFYERIFVKGEKPPFPKITRSGDIAKA